MSWAADEFHALDLGDRRLNRRTVLLAERLAAQPMASIPGACGGWAETQAAYRLLGNDDIGWEVVTDVTPSTCTEGWDCTVPGPYTFSLSTGTIVQDTVNLHVPVSQAGIRDVR